MPIQESDIQLMYTGSGSSTSTELSLGGTISLNTVPSGINNIFDDVTGSEAALGVTHYRGIGIQNNHESLNYLDTIIWISGYNRAGGVPDTISIGVKRPSGTPSSIPPVASETIEPSIDGSWVIEGSPSSTLDLSGVLYVGTIGMNKDWAGLWIRRVVPTNADPFQNRSCTLEIRGRTATSEPINVTIKYIINWKVS